MSKALYVTSTQTFSGKSALCVGLLRRFQKDGLRVGYMKPLSTAARLVEEGAVDEDVLFIRSTFGLTDPLEAMAPVLLSDRRVQEVLAGARQDLRQEVMRSYQVVSRGKDVVVLEGGGSLREGWIVQLAPPHVAQMLGARALVVVPFSSELQVVDDLIAARARLGEALVGSVINSVPPRRMDFVLQRVKGFVERQGVPVLAVLPQERLLLSASVREICEGVGGELLCGEESLEELVEHLAIGAMGVESALRYFRRRPNKAVITGGDRPEIQLAALETSTRCLILTGNIRPSPLIMGRAQERGVAIILTKEDTMSAIERIEGFFGKTRFHQQKKIERFEELLEEGLDMESLYKALGMSRP
jgi:hypothetical protein